MINTEVYIYRPHKTSNIVNAMFLTASELTEVKECTYACTRKNAYTNIAIFLFSKVTPTSECGLKFSKTIVYIQCEQFVKKTLLNDSFDFLTYM